MARIVMVLSGQASVGLLLVRVMMGIILVFHGYVKVFVIGLPAAQGFFAKVGIFLPQITAPFVSFLELIGGVLLIVGLFTRYLGVLFAIEFVVAAYTQWVTAGKGYPGAELELLLLICGLLLATHGAGPYSVDRNRPWDT